MNRMRTPRAAARRIASPTIAAVSAPRLKSYCASSSDVSAPSTNAATACAISAGCWPPSVRVRISMRSLIDRLAAARIGQASDFYRVGAGGELARARGAADLLPGRRGPSAAARAARRLRRRAGGSADPARRRGARLSRRSRLRDPVHLRAAADRRGASGGDGDDRAPRARRARARRARLALERRSEPSRHCDDEPPADARRDRAGPRLRGRARRRAAGRRRRPRRARGLRRRVRAPSLARRRGRVRARPACSNRRVSPVRRNALLLAGGLVFQSGMIQLAVALGTVTIVSVTGVQGILGLGPAIFLIAGALAVGPAGRLSDRVGRMPVIRGGFVLGTMGRWVAAAGCAWGSGPLVVLGLALCGAGQTIVLLSRAAAAEMFPPERRARGMSIVLFGVVSGAI